MGKKTAKTPAPAAPSATVHVVLPDARILQAILKVAAAIVDDVRLVFKPTGLAIRAMDAGHVGLLAIDLPASFFETCAVAETTPWVVNIKDFSKVVARAGAGTALDLRITPEDAIYLQVGILAGKRRRTFKVREVAQALTLPDNHDEKDALVDQFTTDLAAQAGITVQFASEMLAEILGDVGIVSDVVRMEFDAVNKWFVFSAWDPTSTYQQETKILTDDPGILDIKEHREDFAILQGMYSADLLGAFLQIKPVAKEMSFTMIPARGDKEGVAGGAMPLCMAATIMGSDLGTFKFALAPRTEENDDDLDEFDADSIESALEGEEFEVTEEDMGDEDDGTEYAD